MSFAVTSEERIVLQFFFGLLNRVLATPSLREAPMMGDYAAFVTNVWHMDTGTQSVAELADIHARATGAYEAYARGAQGPTLAAILREETSRYPCDGAGAAQEQQEARVFYEAFFTFFAMTLARMHGASLGAEDLRMLHRHLLPSAQERVQFHTLAVAQCEAQGLSTDEMIRCLRMILAPASRPLDAQKIAIISCVNDEAVYQECRARLEALVVPDGWSLDFVPVRRAPSMCAGYTEGMTATDARYKLYLHQDMMLEKRDILLTILPFFQQHPEVGLIGLAGNRYWRPNGIWWEDENSYLHIAHGAGAARHAFDVGTMAGSWQRMAMLDGVFLMTQADVPWRADLLRGWHFYDIAACAEFRRAGYGLAVPRQDTPWFTHLGGDKDVDIVYHYWRVMFLEAYGKEIEAWRHSRAAIPQDII